MDRSANIDDVNLILRLYEMRREPRLREARAWFASSFKFQSWEECIQACPPGTDANAFFRQVTTYWEMVASIVASGVLQKDLFFQSGRELLLVWERLRPMIASWRAATRDQMLYHNLETVGAEFAKWMNQRSPGSYEAFAERMRGLR
ncbi:MAG: hypothetical protein IPM24_18510 [Bryobacterales bacterium]|nr:hypothetical protein [Bryobacterales bacterium]